MIEHISKIVDSIINSKTLSKIEESVIGKYESLLPREEVIPAAEKEEGKKEVVSI